jgi:hypothetical protein
MLSAPATLTSGLSLIFRGAASAGSGTFPPGPVVWIIRRHLYLEFVKCAYRSKEVLLVYMVQDLDAYDGASGWHCFVSWGPKPPERPLRPIMYTQDTISYFLMVQTMVLFKEGFVNEGVESKRLFWPRRKVYIYTTSENFKKGRYCAKCFRRVIFLSQRVDRWC